MSVLITGGAGYIGSHCGKVFLENNREVIVLDDLSNGHEEAVGEGKLIIGDIGDKDLLNDIFSRYDIEGVIHFAAQKSVGESVEDPSLYYEENVLKTKVLLDSMLKNNIKRIVLSSSAAVYGDADVDVIDESYRTIPINPYGETKLVNEKMMHDYDVAYGLKFCSLRYFNAAGADPSGEIGFSSAKEKNILPLLVSAIKNKKEFTVFGNDYETRDGTCVRDYIHVSDLGEAHLLAFDYLLNNSDSQIINLGSNNGYTVLELITETENVTGEKLNYKIGPRRAGDPDTLIASNKKAKELLGWEPKYSDIKDIIANSYHWEKNRKY